MPSDEKEELTWLEGLKVGDKVAIVRIVPGAPDNVSEGVVSHRTKTLIIVNGGKFSSKSGWASNPSSFLKDRIVELTGGIQAEITRQRTHVVLSRRVENITKLLKSHTLSAAEMESLYAAIVKWRTEHNVPC